MLRPRLKLMLRLKAKAKAFHTFASSESPQYLYPVNLYTCFCAIVHTSTYMLKWNKHFLFLGLYLCPSHFPHRRW